MNLRDLAYLVAVADARHFGRAAEASNVSQPTLSGQIRKLEESLGVVLFERDSRNVTLTPAGTAVVAEARSVLAHARAIGDIAAAYRDPLAGRFRLGVIASLGPFIAADVLVRLRKDVPQMELMLTEGLTDDLLLALRSGEIDAALIATAPGDHKIQELALFDEPFLIGCAASHPLASLRNPSVEDIETGTLLLLGDGHCLRDQALSLCGATSVDARVKATSLMTLMRLAATGHGVTLVPALAAKAVDGLILKKLDAKKAHRRIRLVARRQFVRTAALQALASSIASVAVARGLKKCASEPKSKA
jgi:LysR family hydrogen peroxide-inducible transcriptional activator